MKISIKKGLDLRLQGVVDTQQKPIDITVSRVALTPDDFEGFVPKTGKRPGDKVLVGEEILHDKNNENIKIVSPLAGTVVAVNRGARRHIDSIVIEAENTSGGKSDSSEQYKFFEKPSNPTSRQLIEMLAYAGLLVFIRRRPFADIPDTTTLPRDIFVTAFDSAPLAVNRQWSDSDVAYLQSGASVLGNITCGKVYVSHRDGQSFPELQGVENVLVKGPHPSGLAGVQAANIAPLNAGETIWTLSAETMWRIGRLMTDGVFDPGTEVAVCGSCVTQPYIARTIIGAAVAPLLKDRLTDCNGHARVISGNVLTGIKTDIEDGYLHFPYTQLTVISEGDDKTEFMGWASVSPSKMSVSPSFPGFIMRRRFNPDARVLGGRRAMIMSGQYDRYLPMDIYAEYLIKAIRNRNIESMEQLGIYEVAPEDFALAECLDSSRLPLQSIVREGLDYLRKELN